MNSTSFWKSRRGQQTTVIIAFLLIPVGLLILFTYFPFLKMVQFSFYNMKYIGARKFVGLRNYRQIFQRDDIIRTLLLSLYYMVGSVVQVFLALYLAHSILLQGEI